MKGLVADINVIGHWRIIRGHLEGALWGEVWASLKLTEETFKSLGLPLEVVDSVLWKVCQEKELILLTDNRNADSPDSLEVTIRAQNTSTSLPVFTIGDSDRIMGDKLYAQRAAEKLLD